jgi:high-affinity K+ transport system ATPase subunit B
MLLPVMFLLPLLMVLTLTICCSWHFFESQLLMMSISVVSSILVFLVSLLLFKSLSDDFSTSFGVPALVAFPDVPFVSCASAYPAV